jgi:hypothetical protein
VIFQPLNSSVLPLQCHFITLINGTYFSAFRIIIHRENKNKKHCYEFTFYALDHLYCSYECSAFVLFYFIILFLICVSIRCLVYEKTQCSELGTCGGSKANDTLFSAATEQYICHLN